jgi:hypothetical protein
LCCQKKAAGGNHLWSAGWVIIEKPYFPMKPNGMGMAAVVW